jgi:hypothetical protein
MQDQIGLQHLLQRGAEGGDQLMGQIADETHRVGQDDLRPPGSRDRPHRRVQRGEQHVLGQNLGPGQRLNSVDFPALV